LTGKTWIVSADFIVDTSRILPSQKNDVQMIFWFPLPKSERLE